MSNHLYYETDKTIRLVLMGIGMVFISSCSKDPLSNISNEDSRVYITQKSDSADFSSYSTFYIADSVAVIEGSQSTKAYTPIGSSYIKSTIKYLRAAGYSQTKDSSQADLGVTVSRVISYTTGYYDYSVYWGGFASYWDTFFIGDM